MVEQLLNWLMFSGVMMFAAGEVALGGGGDASAAAASGEVAAGGDGAADAATADAGLGGDAEAGTAGQDTGDAGPADAGDQALGDQDGRAIPAALRQHLAELKQTNPQLAKELKTLFFADRALKQHFPGGVPEAIKAKQFYETAGGEEGLQELQATAQELAEIDRRFEAADPEFVAGLAKDSPGAFAKLAPQVLEHWATVDREGYNYSLARVMINTLTEARVIDGLAQIESALAAGNLDAAKQAFAPIAKAINAFDSLAAKQPERKLDPEREKFERDRQQWETQKQQDFQKAVATEFVDGFRQKVRPLLDAQLKPFGLKLDAMERSDQETLAFLVDNIDKRLATKLNQDRQFVRNRDSLLKTMDRQKLGKLYGSAIDRYLPEAVREIVRLAYKGRKPAAAAPATDGNALRPAPAGTVRLPKAPARELIDYERTSKDMILAGKVYLKGKKELHLFE